MMNYGSKAQRNLYFAMPYFGKNLLGSAYGADQRLRRFGKHFWPALRFLSESQYWDNERSLAYQADRIGEFLEQSICTVPFYREHPAYLRWKSAPTLKDAPILTKDTVRAHISSLYSDKMAQLKPEWGHTSGTTGKSLVFPLSQYCFQREYAFRTLHYRWCGMNAPGREPVAICQGHPVAHCDRQVPPYWVRDLLNNHLILSSYHLSYANMAEYARVLDSFQPLMLTGYPSSLYLLAVAYQRHGKGTLRLKGAYTTSETLFESQRRTIESVFRCRVFDWYGNSEMCGNIVECEYGERHAKYEHSCLEIVDQSGNPVPPGGTGRLLCTGFGNFAFPLIRYDVGDVVTISESQISKCGRSGLLIDRILGRVEDYVITAKGRMVGRLDHLFKDSKHVIEAQVVQTTPGEVILRIVRTPEFGPKDEKAIREEAALRLGSDTAIVFQYVESIQRGNNGKFQFVVSRIAVKDHEESLSLSNA
jgi:phenylacetate-CoA ligase